MSAEMRLEHMRRQTQGFNKLYAIF